MLSQVLMELMAQQDVRKRELIDMLAKMEREREGERKDFWLLQYQRLLDSQPEDVDFDSTVDPELGYNFLANGVVHCLPFLSRLWQDKSKTLPEINDEDLKAAGIRKESDRCGILKSIAQFLENRREKLEAVEPSGSKACAEEEEREEKEKAEKTNEKDQLTDNREVDQMAECVICMDKRVSLFDSIFCGIMKLLQFISCFQVQIIFLLCGHLACCDDCHENVDICPMCRAPIQQRIRVIQA